MDMTQDRNQQGLTFSCSISDAFDIWERPSLPRHCYSWQSSENLSLITGNHLYQAPGLSR